MDRTCSKCRQSKPDADFSSVTSGYCKECFRAYRREKYVPVADRALRDATPDWRAKHDAKICLVCGRTGADSPFRSLAVTRCSDCMAKNLYRCPTHGRIRVPRCPKCRSKTRKAQAKARRREEYQKERSRIFLMRGDGTCAKCGKMIREQGKIDRGHNCE